MSGQQSPQQRASTSGSINGFNNRTTESQTTHWDGCWRDHLACAVARIEILEKALAFYADLAAKVIT